MLVCFTLLLHQYRLIFILTNAILYFSRFISVVYYKKEKLIQQSSKTTSVMHSKNESNLSPANLETHVSAVHRLA